MRAHARETIPTLPLREINSTNPPYQLGFVGGRVSEMPTEKLSRCLPPVSRSFSSDHGGHLKISINTEVGSVVCGGVA